MHTSRSSSENRKLRSLKNARQSAKTAFDKNELLRGEAARQYRRSVKNQIESIDRQLAEILLNNKPRSDVFLNQIGFTALAEDVRKKLASCEQKIDLKDGRRSLESFHLAAVPLLNWYEKNVGKVTGWRRLDLDGEKFSKAAHFLNEEFQLITGDRLNRHGSCVTVIKNRLKLNKERLPY